MPYLAHLLVVTGLVVEDGGGRAMLERIERTFGPSVAGIVEGCSDTVDVDPTESWIARKRRYLDHLPGVEDDAILRVALADKVHNARSIVRDYREEGHPLWERFTQKTAREHAASGAPEVIDWLTEQDRDRWPAERIAFHGEATAAAGDRVTG